MSAHTTEGKEQEAMLEENETPPSYFAAMGMTQPPTHSAGADGADSRLMQPGMVGGGPEGDKALGYYPQAQAPQLVIMGPRGIMPDAPNDHLIYSIIATIFCCWPIGIFAITKSLACKDAIARGDYTTANEMSRRARRLANWTIGVGIVFMVASVAIIVVMYVVALLPVLMDSVNSERN